MTPTDLLSAIRAALDDTERKARTMHARTCGHDAVDADAPCYCDWHVATVLRWVAAMRETVALHHSQPASGFDTDGWEHHGYGCAVCYFADSYPCPTIRALARGLGIDPEETP